MSDFGITSIHCFVRKLQRVITDPLLALRRKMMATCHLSSAKDKLQDTAGDRLTSNLYKMFSGMKQQPSHVKKTALNGRKLSTVLSTQW